MDPISVISSCIKIAKDIYSLKKSIEKDDAACKAFFLRIESLEAPLNELQIMKLEALNTRSIAIDQIHAALVDIDRVMTERIRKQLTASGKLSNAVGTYLGRFTSCVSELNSHLDRCIAALQLAVTIDGTAAILSDTSEIRDQSDKISAQLDMIARKLQSQGLANVMEDQFTRDPLPLDFYDERSVLGHGSFGVTHRMLNCVDGGLYAVKEIKVNLASADGLTKADLAKESMLLQKLNHPHIVRYFTSFFSRSETIYNVVMELIPGGSLSAKIQDESLTIGKIATWFNQMVETLHYLHNEAHVLHRDIKPENILLNEDGSQIKLIDLGMASVMRSSASKMSKVGTSTYFSYEKANDIPYDGRDDVWAAGCVFAELLTKSRLSTRGGAIYLYTNTTVNDRRLQLIADCCAVNSKFGSILSRMLEPEQENRCTTDDLMDFIRPGQRSTSSTSPSGSVKSSNASAEATAPAVRKSLANSPMTGPSSLFPPRTNPSPPPRSESDVNYTAVWSSSSTISYGGNINVISATHDGTKFAVGGDMLTANIYRSDTKKCYATIHTSPKGWMYSEIVPIKSLALNSDGSRLVVSLRNENIYFFDVKTAKLLKSRTVTDFSSYGNLLCFNPSGSKVAVCRRSGHVLIDANNHQVIHYERETKTGVAIAYSRRGDTLLTQAERQFCLINTRTNEIRFTGNYDARTTCGCLSSNASRVAVGYENGTVEVWVQDTGGTSYSNFRWTHHEGEGVECISMSLDDSCFATGSRAKAYNGGTVKIWNLTTFQCMQTISHGNSWVSAVCFIAENTLVTGSRDGNIKVWSCEYCAN